MFGLDQGLTGTVIGDFSQDKEGALWIASDDGINRFDGEYIESYTRLQGFTDDFKLRVFADSKGKIWCTQGKSYNTLEIIDKKSKTMRHFGVSEGLSNEYITGIMEDKKGRIWISTLNGLNVLDEKQGTIQIINKENGLAENRIQCMLEDQEGNIWLGTNGKGIDILDKKSGKIRHLDNSTGLQSNAIRALSQNEKGEVWVGTDEGVEIIQLNEGYLRHFNASNGLNTINNITSISFDNLGHVWISTQGAGVEVFDPIDQSIKHLNAEKGLGNDIVMKVFTDACGQVWMGTLAGEINIYNPLAGNMQHFTSAQGLNNKSHWVFALSEDARGKKWIGSGEGIDIIDEKKGAIQHFNENGGLNNNGIAKIFSDSKGRTWVGTYVGMNMIDENAGVIRAWNNGFSIDIMEDSKGSIWFTNEGILVYDVAENIFKKVNKENGLISDRAGYILEDGSGQVWVSNEFGLSVIDSSKKLIKTIENKFLRNIDIYKIIQDSRGLIWLGTYGNGVVMLDLNVGTITQFSVKEGLSDRLVLSVVEKEGKIYAGTNNGISVFTPIEQSTHTGKNENIKLRWSIKNHGKPQGLARVDHNPSSMLTKDGRLWWGFAHVLTIMEEPEEDTIAPKAQIIDIEIMGKQPKFCKP